jgi:LysR family glycine cleavage system transcriptional activator
LGRNSLTAPYLTTGRLVAPFALSLPVAEGFFVLEPVTAHPHPQARAFVDWLVGQAVTP